MKGTTIYISKENLLTNHALLTDFAGTPVWPVLKSNAYGHGIDQVAQILSNTSAEYFIVQNYFEAEQVWDTLPDQQVLMLGTEIFSLYKDMDFTRVTPVVGSLQLLESLIALDKEISIHIKINTGMNRQGFGPAEIPQITTLLQNNTQITMAGVMTHFSDADGSDVSFTNKQYACFESCISQFKEAGVRPKWIHASNSAGLSKVSPDLVNASRSGIGLYGLNPLEKEDEKYEPYEQLKPVLSLHTCVTHLRNIKPGEVVGYGNTYVADKETRIATIPVGYYEGIPRLMSSTGTCSTKNGQPLPIVGRVSMNLITLDATGSEASVGDEIIVYGRDKNTPNSITNNASLAGTISYELTTNLKPHLPRVIV